MATTAPLPSSLASKDLGRPRVAVTLGTILPGRLDAMQVILDIEQLEVEVVATVGPGLDPASLGPRPDWVHVERYVPMSLLLATSDALVFHGGSGTMLAALANGVPLVWSFRSRRRSARERRPVRRRQGVALDVDHRAAGDIARAAEAVLRDPRYAQAARRVQAEIEAAMPMPAAVLLRLEQLCRRPGRHTGHHPVDGVSGLPVRPSDRHVAPSGLGSGSRPSRPARAALASKSG
ncbi:MAG: hypothetical protein U0838_01410 [Chloroflexota bacterium]